LHTAVVFKTSLIDSAIIIVSSCTLQSNLCKQLHAAAAVHAGAHTAAACKQLHAVVSTVHVVTHTPPLVQVVARRCSGTSMNQSTSMAGVGDQEDITTAITNLMATHLP